MVKAIAPNAPIGAAFMMMPTIAEKHVRGLVDEAEQRLAALAEHVQREGEQHGEEQHLQDLALGEGADHGVGDDVHAGTRRCSARSALACRLRSHLVSSALASTFMPAPGCQS